MKPRRQSILALQALLAAVGSGAFALTASADPCPLTLLATDAGWYSAAGFHGPFNANFLVGSSGGVEVRDFFVFDLPPLNSPLVSAELRWYTFTYQSPDATETLELHHVATPVTTLTAGGGPGLVYIFQDLGEGPVYGTRAVAVGEGNNYITLSLNSNALAAIAAASGQRFAMGGRLTTLTQAPGVEETLFGNSAGASGFVQLNLTMVNTNAPDIYRQPIPDTLALSGVSFDFQIAACGAAPLFYQWFFKGSLLPNQTNAFLHLANVTTNDAGNYFAVVTNSVGVATSSLARLSVDFQGPSIFPGPSDTSVLVGNTAYFSASAFGNPFPSLQWQFNGANLPGATNSYLQIDKAQFNNSGTYTFVVSNIYGTLSRSAVLSVEPLLIFGPYDNAPALGNDFYLFVSASSPTPLTYQWRFNGTNIAGAQTPGLSLFDISPANSGGYDVIVANSYGVRTSRVAQIYVIADPPHLTISSSGNSLIGSDQVLSVNVSGSLPVQLQWYFNDSPITAATNAQLLLPNLTTNNSGSYFLIASNAYGSVTSSVLIVTARSQAPSLFPGITARDAYVGDTIRLSAFVQAGPPARLQWYFNGEIISGATNTALLLTDVALSQSGFYDVSAMNPSGTNTSRYVLSVQPRRALDRWTWRNPRPQANDLKHIVGGLGRYVAAGEGGSLVTSTNGVDWTVLPLGNHFEVTGLAFGNGLFAALVRSDSVWVCIFISPDGLAWTPHDIPTLRYAGSLDFANGQFLVTGSDASTLVAAATSPDGVVWQGQPLLGPSSLPTTVSYGNGVYVSTSYYELFTSSDGLRWKRNFVPGSYFAKVRFLNGMFVVLGGFGEIWTSTDGSHWSARNSGALLELDGAAYGNGRFVAVGADGTIVSSTDAATWSAADATTSKNLTAVVFDGARFVVSGNDGVLLTSPDGMTWVDPRLGRTKDLYGIVHANGLFVAVGYSGTILNSPDGVNWTRRTSPSSLDLHALTYGAGQFVAVGRDGTVLTSPNGINWTSRSTPTTNYLERITYGSGTYVAVGSAGTVLTSSNAVNWMARSVPVPASTELEGVAYGNGLFVVVGGFFTNNARSIIFTSTNGVDWIDRSLNTGVIFRGVIYADGYFLIVGNDGQTLYSTNALNWSSQSTPPYRNLRHATFGAGRFVAVGNEGTIISSHPLGAWSVHASLLSQNLHDVAYGQGRFVAVGNAGAIVQSEAALPSFSAPGVSVGMFQFMLSGGMEESYAVQRSDNFLSWTNTAVFTNNGEGVSFSDNSNPARRFYRAVTP